MLLVSSMKHRPKDALNQVANYVTDQQHSRFDSGKAIHFHIPDYRRRAYNAPQLVQDEFDVDHTVDGKVFMYEDSPGMSKRT